MLTYNDIVYIDAAAPSEMRPGAKAWVVGITAEQERHGSYFKQFPSGIVYLVEFEDGYALDFHEDMLTPRTA